MIYKGISIWIWAKKQIGVGNRIICKRIQKYYDIDKYTKFMEEVVTKVMQTQKTN